MEQQRRYPTRWKRKRSSGRRDIHTIHALWSNPFLFLYVDPYYNATILSGVLEERRAAGDLVGVARLTRVAPVAWQHINFYGRYEFTSQVAPIDLERAVAALLQNANSATEHVA
jgi:Tn3 transposase DDE domain